ncbi:zinc-binding metallopeptidase family protein [Bowmanella dokdonensis]|uniref:Zinc-binding peptidase n=1 Tax=Bowmanella dokdonensis TaxID=751969 RepID=A0A939DKP5_9ALTE|nr:putative zinc-binding peptidase [Bowmanella dokdonensis]MBN7824319.1 putative zinc-binding peptidase [Bowmanella dokdonensis]
MKLFSCNQCRNLLYFENTRCTACAAVLGFLPDQLDLVALRQSSDKRTWYPIGGQSAYRMCVNYAQHQVCNWMVEDSSDQEYCLACRLNQTIPDLSVSGNLLLWQRLETEKRRLVYSLLQLGLPVEPKNSSGQGLAFDFLADTAPSFSELNKVRTGHSDGLITLNIAEADDAERERMREQMAEPYRTILGHFRHESGHYYWDRLIRDSQHLRAFRGLFGDERLDYQQALQNHYRQGPPEDWQQRHVSAYASSHAWEDWAETWAHYLHMVDTLETAQQFGMRIDPQQGRSPPARDMQNFNAYGQGPFEPLIEHWLPLTYALNSLNRSMGHAHAYPFYLSGGAMQKLGFVHQLVHGP